MKNYRVMLSTLCKEQIESIYRYLNDECHNHQSAEAFLDGTEDLITSLEEFPHRFPVRKYSKQYLVDIRQFCYVMDYIAFYAIDENKKIVTIIEVRYGKQNLK